MHNPFFWLSTYLYLRFSGAVAYHLQCDIYIIELTMFSDNEIYSQPSLSHAVWQHVACEGDQLPPMLDHPSIEDIHVNQGSPIKSQWNMKYCSVLGNLNKTSSSSWDYTVLWPVLPTSEGSGYCFKARMCPMLLHEIWDMCESMLLIFMIEKNYKMKNLYLIVIKFFCFLKFFVWFMVWVIF